MIVGILKELKNNENRVALTPAGTQKLTSRGNNVLIEQDAGEGSGFANEEYEKSGATITNKSQIFKTSALILKIKEPLPEEYAIFKPGQMLFTFFHFASNKALTEAMINASVTCIAYETVETEDKRVPLLAPMSIVAGKMASIAAANYLSKTYGGKGVLSSPVGTAQPAHFLILGGGNAGKASAEVALGMGADVTLIEKSEKVIESIKKRFPKASFAVSTPENISAYLKESDAVIGTIHLPGSRPPKIVTRKMIRTMEKGSVLVDVAIDQGGCFETSRPTTHSDPVYIEEGIVHYCVSNMPGAFPRSSTLALTSATLPYVLELAQKGEKAFRNKELLKGLNIYQGKVTNRKVAEAHNLDYTKAESLLQQQP
jgi:alanine dehydrogenase